ncbi:hypothetical protein COV53_02205 [Candidatus Gottesmanbacteria bacterium CG11_big_fil_rev_8_21_14_0_20_37_11]|uniref:Type I restriction modification DNA specificity domain-containing protein n=1 Tax=Candidatus Gottesmanbacteria bacterium CG11_big_fil_rev_8_21_14_0_20_37_11 TaxID=1974575 RepID=A0A2H0NI83_9BACT|nr:MAG: hypothetical protein COV53_02205 [Candidatus Gottesmanbacteria bacterium CG11_big_fil_rev_8_21_14_0_20_37_11]
MTKSIKNDQLQITNEDNRNCKFVIRNCNMKPSGIDWLGNVPEEWDVLPIWMLFYMGRGRVISKEEILDNPGEYPVYSSQTENNGNLGGLATYDFEGDYITWTTDGANAGTVFNRSGKFNCTNVCGTLKPKKLKDIDLRFFTHALNVCTKIFVRYDINPKLMNNVLAGINVQVPPIKDQENICNFLDRETARIDEVVAKKQKLMELFKEKRQALITHAVTKGLDPKAKMKPSGIDWLGNIPEGWEVKRFGFLFSFNKGLSITKENLQDEGIPCVNYGEIHSKYGFEVNPLEDDLKCVSKDYLKDNQGSILNFGDFIFADTSEDIKGSGNFTYLNSREVTFAGYHTIIAKLHIQMNFRFLAYLFDSVNYRTQIRSMVAGIKVYSITKEILKNTFVLLPSFLEQKSIVAFLDRETVKIDEMMKKVEIQIEKLHEYRQVLITSAVTGKIKVEPTFSMV